MAWIDNLFRFLGHGRHNTTLPTLGEGDVEEMQVDSRGRLRVALEATSVSLDVEAAEPATRYLSAARERQATAKASGGIAREVSVHSNAAAWLHVFDRATPATAGSAPIYRHVVPAGAQLTVSFTGGRTFATGLVVALSSSAETWADPGADEGLFYVEMD